MAMIKCENCGKDISDKSNSCIYCGVTLAIANLNNKEKNIKRKKHKHSNIKIILIELIVIFLLGIIYLNLFGRRIAEYIDLNHQIKLEKMCNENYLGTWNKEEKVCETAAGDMKIE